MPDSPKKEPAPNGAAVAVEITPEMIEAGQEFLREFMGDEYPAAMLDAEELVAGVYEAMSRSDASIVLEKLLDLPERP